MPLVFWNLRNNILRVLRFSSARPGTGITIFVGIASILISIFLANYISITSLTLYLAVSFLISIYLGGLFAKSSLTPNVYSKLIVSGRSLEEVLCYLAWKSLRIHNRFNKSTKNLVPLLDEIDISIEKTSQGTNFKKIEKTISDKWENKAGTKLCKKVIFSLDKLLRKEHEEFKRLEALFDETARELGIPRHRLANHVIQFSPLLFLNRIKKYKDNLKELTDKIDQELSHQKDLEFEPILLRVFGQISQLKKIRKISSQRIRRARAIINNMDLHSYVHEIAASNSSSASILIYANALSKVASDSSNNLKRWSGDLNDKKYKIVEDRFKMLFRKQKAYPGYDPHEILIHLFQYYLKNKVTNANNGNYQVHSEILKVLFQFKEYFKAKDLCFLIPNDEKFILDDLNFEEKFEKTKRSIRNYIDSLSKVNLLATGLLTTYKRRLVKIFNEDIFPVFFDKTEGFRFIVTHGYSKTVRQIIKHGLDAATKEKNYVFLLEGRSSDKFESQLMKFELQNETSFNKQYFSNIAIGEANILFEMIDANKDRVLIILGAEVFDQQGRVVIAKGIHKEFLKTKKNFDNVGIKYATMIAAENFKGQLSSITNSEPFDDHFDRIEILRYSEIDFIITDELYYNESTKLKIMKKLSDVNNLENDSETMDTDSSQTDTPKITELEN